MLLLLLWLLLLHLRLLQLPRGDRRLSVAAGDHGVPLPAPCSAATTLGRVVAVGMQHVVRREGGAGGQRSQLIPLAGGCGGYRGLGRSCRR